MKSFKFFKLSEIFNTNLHSQKFPLSNPKIQKFQNNPFLKDFSRKHFSHDKTNQFFICTSIPFFFLLLHIGMSIIYFIILFFSLIWNGINDNNKKTSTTHDNVGKI
ncbi:hypothetical protein ACKWTF_009131 [Chironomus riparius]